MQLTLPPSILEIESVEPLNRGLLKSAVRRTQLLRLAMRGMDAKQAALAVGCSHAHALQVYREPEFRRQALAKVESAFASIDASFAAHKLSLHEQIEEQAERSFLNLVELLNQDIHPSLKVKIHQDFLNRCEESQPQHKVNMGHKFSPEELQRAALTAREMDANVTPITKRRVG
jgi:hypothetical protein